MPQSNIIEDEEDAKIKDNNKLMTNSFSASIRLKTLSALVCMVLVFVALVYALYNVLCPTFVSKYERKTSEAEINCLLKDIKVELNVLYVKRKREKILFHFSSFHMEELIAFTRFNDYFLIVSQKFIFTVTYWDPAAEALKEHYRGNPALLEDFWSTIFYDGGVWMIEAPVLSAAAIYDNANMSLIIGEYHPTLENDTAAKPKGAMLDILAGESEESQRFLQGLKEKTVDILITDEGQMLLVAMNDVRYSSDPNSPPQGYLLVAADMRFYLKSFSDSKKIK